MGFSKINIRWIPQQSRDEFVVSLTDDEELTFLPPPPPSFPHIVQREKTYFRGSLDIHKCPSEKEKDSPIIYEK